MKEDRDEGTKRESPPATPQLDSVSEGCDAEEVDRRIAADHAREAVLGL